jgi:L-asparaginase
MDSREITQEHWLTLGKAAQEALAQSSGVVITHGSDTLEETAFFLSQVCPAPRPLVLTAALRPADHLSPDGPMNLLQSLHLAAWPEARGVMVLLQDVFYDAAQLVKSAPNRLHAFSAPDGELGQMQGFVPCLKRNWPPGQAAFTLPASAPLPLVGLLYGHVGMNMDMVREYIATGLEAGMKGLVYAAPGNGSVSLALGKIFRAAMDRGLKIVVSSRTGQGWVDGEEKAEDDSAPAWSHSGWDGPLKARIKLMLSLLP